jgi:MFS transporter, DHA1 family, multidrug resistance protein
MTLFGAVLGISVYRILPETHPREKRPHLHLASLAAVAWSIAKHGEFLLLALAMGANFAAMLCFIGAAPAVVVDHWHLAETQFAHLFFPIIGGLFGGAFLSGRMAGRITYTQQSRVGFILALTGSALMTLLLAVFTTPPIFVQQALILVIALGAQLAGPTLSLRMLDLFPHARGSAASVQSCVSIAISALVFGVLSPSLSGSMLSLAAGSFCSALLGFLLFRLALRALARRVEAA